MRRLAAILIALAGVKRFAVVSSGIAILALTAGSGRAADWQIEADNYFNASGVYPQIANDSNNAYYFTAPTGLTATVDGAVWLKTGSATPVLNTQNFGVSVYYKNADGTNGGWTYYETEFVNDGGYAGYFLGDANYITDSNLAIVGEETIPTTDYGGVLSTWNQGLFYLQMWTDNGQAGGGASPYSTFAAAYAASAAGVPGVYAAQTAAFLVDLGPGGIMPFDYVSELMYMPAVVMRSGISGDANYDGKVDINDLTVVLAHYGQTGMTWSQGDFNADGKVDINDLTVVLAHYGQTAGASAPAGASAVPEPSALLLGAAALVGCLVFAGRRLWQGGSK